jgi:hypothetical protein
MFWYSYCISFCISFYKIVIKRRSLMKKYFYPVFLIMFFALIISNCSDDSSSSGNENMGTLSISLTDAPAAYDSVIIVFSEISAHIDSEWVHVKQEPVRINLLEWSNGETILLGSADVPAGKYTQIRIKIDSAFIGVNGQVYELIVPSGSKTGLKLGPQFTITEGSTYEMILDFDACRSVVVTGPKHNPNSYKLKPHIRVITQAVSGSISGTVLNPEKIPFAYAIVANDTITTTAVDTATGFFKLAFLDANNYTIVVEDTSGRNFSQDLVPVQTGQDNYLGDITLN